MPENYESAETSIEETNVVEDNAVGEVADTDNEQQEVNDVEFTDTEVEENDDSNKPEAKKTQTSEQNAEFARKRREQETKARIEKAEEEARIKTLIEMNDGVNPYTQEPMTDKVDVQKYLAMKEIEKSGGDPIADYHKVHSQKQKEEIENQRKKQEEEEWYANDRKEFFSKHPEMTDKSLSEILKNRQFLLYGEGKFGKMPLSKIYEGYQEVVSAFEGKAKSMAEKLYANKKSSPGSLNSTEVSKAKSWGDMTREEFEAELRAAKDGKYKKT